MTQKILKIGNKATVAIPQKSLKKWGLNFGDEVNIEIDKKIKTLFLSKEDMRIAELTLNFIDRYRKDLEALAKK